MKWVIEYEYFVFEVFNLNYFEINVFCENCNVIFRYVQYYYGNSDVVLNVYRFFQVSVCLFCSIL